MLYSFLECLFTSMRTLFWVKFSIPNPREWRIQTDAHSEVEMFFAIRITIYTTPAPATSETMAFQHLVSADPPILWKGGSGEL